MDFLPKVKKGLASALTKSEKIRKAVFGVALATSVAITAAMLPNVANARNPVDSPVPILLSVSQEMPTGYHYSHSSHYSHASHQSHSSHYSSRW